jgi:hypothetical protein
MLDEQSILISYGVSSAEVHQIALTEFSLDQETRFSYKANLNPNELTYITMALVLVAFPSCLRSKV